MSRGERFARNVGWGVSGQLAIAAVNLAVIPKLVKGFGVETYALYLLMNAAAGWIGALHFGVGNAITRYAAEAQAQDRRSGLDDAARHGLLVFTGAAAAAAAVLWAAAPWLAAKVFSVPAIYQQHGEFMIRAAALGSVLAAVSSCCAAAFQGLHRFDLVSAAGLLQGLLIPLSVLGALSIGRGLKAGAIGFVGVHAGVAVLSLAALARERAKLRAGGARITFEHFIMFSIGFWPSSLAQLVSGQLDRAFVAGLRSMSEFTLYAVPAGLLSRLQSFPATASAALLPVVVGHAGEDLTRPYLRASRVLAGLIIPAHALLFALMPQFLSLWLGGSFGDASVWPARLLVAAQGFALFAFLPNAVAAARRDGWWFSAASWAQALICLALWPLLIPKWGLLGAAAGGLAAQAVSSTAFVAAVHSRLLHLSWLRFAREALLPAACGVAAMSVLAWPLRTRVTGWADFLALCAASGATYTYVFWRLLPREDREFLRERLPF